MKSLRDVVVYHAHVIKAGFTSNIYALNQLIHFYSTHGLLQHAQKLFDEMPHRNVFSWNAIISAYIKAHKLAQARALLDSASHKDLVSYNSMLSGYVGADGYETEAIDLFIRMQSVREKVGIDDFTLTIMLNLASKLRVAIYGRQIHSYMLKTGNDGRLHAVSSLIDMYSKCGSFDDAWIVFSGSDDGKANSISRNAMLATCFREGKVDMGLNLFWENPELNDTVSWNTLISGYAQNGYVEKSLALFIQMVQKSVRWDVRTLASVLSACSSLKCLKLGKSVHAWVLKTGFIFSNQIISSAVVDLYCKCGYLKYAESVHARIGTNNPFLVASFISGYSYEGKIEEAQRVFDSLTEKNSVVWTALISGYLKTQQFEEVFNFFREYMNTKSLVIPDALVIISVLGACALQAALTLGKQIHAFILRMRLEVNEKLLSALVDMYSKCGNISYAEKIFLNVTDSDRDAVFYNVMVAGYAHHGFENEAFRLFQEMLKKNVKPDAVTFVALLSACRHRGLVQQGERFFRSMEEDHEILPESDHYACMVDMYGRANQLNKAVEFMTKIPIQNKDATIWGAFINACRVSGNTELAKEAEEELLKIDVNNGARYVQLANVYAAEGNWDEMGRIRKKMRGKEVKKLAGCSWIYVENGVHVFTSGDTSHPKSDAIYLALVCLDGKLHLSPIEVKQCHEDLEEFCY